MKRSFDVDSILKTLRSVFPTDKDFISLHEPQFSGNEWNYVKECLDTGWVSSVGKYVDKFEQQLAQYTGVKRAVAVVNGTSALHICLRLAGVSYDDEVLMPAMTFVATANAVKYCGAIPHFVDSEEKTLGVDPRKLSTYLAEIADVSSKGCINQLTGRRLKALIAVHTFGHPVDLSSLSELCNNYNIALIEDAAESVGSFYKEKHTGNWGLVSAISFNGNKIITTGGGGAILTNSEEIGALAKHITTTAKLPHKWAFNHDMVGYNYRMPNINAALGCAQIEQLPVFLKEKRKLAERYQFAFRRMEGISLFKEPVFSKSNYWLNTILLDKDYADGRDMLVEVTNNNGIMTRPPWTLMHKLPMFKKCLHMDLTVSEDLEKRLISIPSSASLGVMDANV